MGGRWRTHPPAHPTPVSCFSLRSICSGPGCFQEPGWSCFPTLTNSCRLWSSLCLSSWAGSYFCQMPDLLLWFVPGKIFVWWKCALFYQTENVLGYKVLKWKSSIQPLSVIPFSLLSGLQASNVVLFGWFFFEAATLCNWPQTHGPPTFGSNKSQDYGCVPLGSAPQAWWFLCS